MLARSRRRQTLARNAEAEKVLEQLKLLSKRRYVPSYEIAVVCAGLGENNEAFAWLQKLMTRAIAAGWLTSTWTQDSSPCALTRAFRTSCAA